MGATHQRDRLKVDGTDGVSGAGSGLLLRITSIYLSCKKMVPSYCNRFCFVFVHCWLLLSVVVVVVVHRIDTQDKVG